jgi:small subunit ribosomal protein S20
MAHSLSAKKRVRQNASRRALNRWRVGGVRSAIKDFNATVLRGEIEQAQTQLKAIYKLLDQVGSTSSMHKNTASRYKSRLTVRLNALKASKAGAAGAPAA